MDSRYTIDVMCGLCLQGNTFLTSCLVQKRRFVGLVLEHTAFSLKGKVRPQPPHHSLKSSCSEPPNSLSLRVYEEPRRRVMLCLNSSVTSCKGHKETKVAVTLGIVWAIKNAPTESFPGRGKKATLLSHI